MIIRPATREDVHTVAALIFSAGPEVYDFIYAARNGDALGYIRFEFQSGRGYCGHHNIIVAEQDGQVVGAGCFFDGTQLRRLMLGTIANMVLFYGVARVWGVLLRADELTSIMHTPGDDEVYMSELGVVPAMRSQGIGARILKAQMDTAQAAGFRKMSLSVAENNPRAERFYERLGFKFVKLKTFKGRGAEVKVPNARRMECVLDDRHQSTAAFGAHACPSSARVT